MRRRVILTGLLATLCLAALPACERFAGPLESRRMRPDTPGYNLDEQAQRGRASMALFDDDFRVGPRGYIDKPSPIGR
jgi:hypothetical protein